MYEHDTGEKADFHATAIREANVETGRDLQMKKKLLTVMMAVMMAFSLSGCGNDVIVDVVTNDVESGSNQADTSNSGTAQGEQTASAQVAETNPAGLKTIR